MISSPENIKKAEDILQGLGPGKIYIYGAGNAGAMTFKLLQDAGIEVQAFFDRRAETGGYYCGRPVYKAAEADLSGKSRKESVIIIAFICDCLELADVRQRLLELGWEKIYYFHDIYNCLVCGKGGHQEDRKDFINCALEKVIKVAELMEDDESYEVFENFFKAIISGNPAYFSLPSEKPQYFVDDVPFNKGYARFIDCGAFDGDTALALKRYRGEAEALVLFEPDSENFKSLCANLKNNRIAKEQVLFPCGVWRNSEMLRFRSGIKSSSGISENGDTFIQCIAIDDAIADFAPTFVKMDIEGAEYEALAGAEQTIRRYMPDLAISVYHRIEHLWQVPLLIESIAPGYKFYLRCHGLHGMETILYAVGGT
ncbi:methyltransferase FkbM family [Desulfocucumis palustris]|uniref:Methyltransferase FkbM family n=1 Tax=Desulfocucumis palustris TaxID=1898651 RepID=A0A2L2XBF3_9FIRM|nr:methyltransferase FkbM family [Desulfocucumis palustris]